MAAIVLIEVLVAKVGIKVVMVKNDGGDNGDKDVMVLALMTKRKMKRHTIVKAR